MILDIYVFGPETHITEIVPLALLGHGSGLDNFSDKSNLSSSDNSLQDQMLGTATTRTIPKNSDLKGKKPSFLKLDNDTTVITEESEESNSRPTTPIANPRERMTYFEKP